VLHTLVVCLAMVELMHAHTHTRSLHSIDSAGIIKAVLGRHHLVHHGVGTEFCDLKFKCPGPFDPNGLWGVLPSIFHVMLGFTAGRAIKLYGNKKAQCTARLLSWGLGWLLAGVVLDRTGWIPISKTMWSISYCFAMSGVATLLLLLFFLMVDANSPMAVRCTAWRGGILRIAGQNSIALYVISESITPVLASFCVSSGTSPGPACVATGGPNATDNTFVGFILRGLWAIAGGRWSNIGSPVPPACAGNFPTGSWSDCHHWWVTSTLWSVLNVVVIICLAIYFDRKGITIKL
jgi:hypothetical protein